MVIEERRGQMVGTNPHDVLKSNWLKKIKGMFTGGARAVIQEQHPELIDLVEKIVAGGWADVEKELSETFNQTSEDQLTGLYDRRMFFILVEKIILPRMRRLMQPDGTYAPFGHIVMLDIDKFKDINSMFGHKGGDHALTAFGSAIRHHFREDDVIGRTGGDEFVVIAPGIREEDIVSRMEALRAHFQNEPMRMLRVDVPHEYGNVRLTFTFKVEMISDPDSLQARIYAADNDVMRRKALRDDQERRDRRK